MAENDAGSLFYTTAAQSDRELVAQLFVDFQKSKVVAKEHRVNEEDCRLKVEATSEECHLKAEEHTQHMELIVMLHEGKLSREMYEQMKILCFIFILFFFV
jgi:hypothetical protein